MLFSQKFRDNLNSYTLIALNAKIRVKPYDPSEIKFFSNDDLDRVSDSIKSLETEWDGKEFAYFVSEPLARMLIDSKKKTTFSSYKEVKMAGKMELYLAHHERKAFRKDMPDDYIEYLENETLHDWRQAARLDMLKYYFSGVGIFPELDPSEESKRRVIYKNDYEDFIKSLSDVELFKLFGEFRQPITVINQQYDNASTFVQTVMEQIEKYVLILRDLEEPIYIPGDGLGAGSYVCKMLGKKYISCEPNAIGYESHLVGLITYRCSFNIQDAKTCNTVFLGNVANFLSKEERLSLKEMRVCIWDEQPPDIKGWFNGGDVRLWYNYEVVPLMPEMKFKFPQLIRNLSKKYNLIPEDNISAAVLEKLKIKSNPNRKLIITGRPKLGVPSYCIFTRSFSYDTKHGRRGQMKDMVSDLIEWRPDDILLDGYYGKIAIKEYDDNVIRDFEFVNGLIEAKVKNPVRMRFVQMGKERQRVVYLGQNKINLKHQYRFNSDYCYTRKVED